MRLPLRHRCRSGVEDGFGLFQPSEPLMTSASDGATARRTRWEWTSGPHPHRLGLRHLRSIAGIGSKGPHLSLAPRIAVLGDCNIDAWFLVTALPAWGHVTMFEYTQLLAGGKGLNSALACAHMGADVTLLSVIGDDAWGSVLRTQVSALTQAVEFGASSGGTSGSLETDFLLTVQAPTPVCGVLTNEKRDPAYIGTKRLTHWNSVRSIEPWTAALTECNALVVSLEPPLAILTEAIAIAKRAGALIIMNPGPPPRSGLEYRETVSLLDRVDVILPNPWEARQLLAHRKSETDSSMAMAHSLSAMLDPTHIAMACVVRSRVGFDAVYREPKSKQMHEFRRGLVPFSADAVGQGDAFAAGVAIELLAQSSPERAMTVGRAAASVAIRKPGAASAMPSRMDVDAMLRRETG